MKQKLGLSSKVAKDKLNQYGPNEIRDINKVSWVRILWRQIGKNFIIYLLLAAGIVSFLVGKDVTSYAILAIIPVIVLTGFFQEYKAEKAIKALKQMLTPQVSTIRDGREIQIPTVELVPGDIVILHSGERVPADCLIMEQSNLRVDEAILTGESIDVKKIAVTDRKKADRENFVFMGSHITQGKCVAEVLYTGMNTEFGKIAGLISTTEKEMPLQDKVNQIVKVMVYITLAVSISTGVIMLLRSSTPFAAETVIEIMIVVIALAVSAFPESFPVVLMSTLAGGAYKMAKKNAIVNRMSIIETLGETTVICSDKTGTITTGQMTVRNALAGEKEYSFTGVGYRSDGEVVHNKRVVAVSDHPDLSLLLKAAVVCNDARLERLPQDHEQKIIGTPTEGALLVAAGKAGVEQDSLVFKVLQEFPFSSERKMMSVSVQEDMGDFMYSKGAPEILISKCKRYILNGKTFILTEEKRKELEKYQYKLTKKTYRVMAFAYKPLKKASESEEGLVFLGFLGLEDPPRDEVAEAITTAVHAGIAVKMITGDNRETAVEIGRQIGLRGKVLTGPELDTITDEELTKLVSSIVIFARVRPEHKIRIVKSLKDKGEVVTMTGDGVNDAPALKESHIGVAMGKNGTDVSRAVADLVLKDDNFSTIVYAIKSGRTIFNNIQKFIACQLSLNSSELMIIFAGILFGLPVPLLALHILFMNLVTDNLSALSLGFNPESVDEMMHHPRKKTKILTPQLIKTIVLVAVVTATVSLSVFYITLKSGGDLSLARTNTLVALIFLELANAFNFRSFRKTFYNHSLFSNKYLVGTTIISVILTVAVVMTPANKVFELSPLSLGNWLWLGGVSLIAIVVMDIWKIYHNRRIDVKTAL